MVLDLVSLTVGSWDWMSVGCWALQKGDDLDSIAAYSLA